MMVCRFYQKTGMTHKSNDKWVFKKINFTYKLPIFYHKNDNQKIKSDLIFNLENTVETLGNSKVKSSWTLTLGDTDSLVPSRASLQLK